MEKYLAVITARGGSKRIPHKNIRQFFGKPVLAYSIEAAQKAGVFEEIMVSTEDEEIAKTALAYGAAVPFLRSQKNADDDATTEDVIMEVIHEYKNIRLCRLPVPNSPVSKTGMAVQGSEAGRPAGCGDGNDNGALFFSAAKVCGKGNGQCICQIPPAGIYECTFPGPGAILP